MNKPPEVFIAIRFGDISVQSPGIGRGTSHVIKVLETALDALKNEKAEKEVFANEIVIKPKQ